MASDQNPSPHPLDWLLSSQADLTVTADDFATDPWAFFGLKRNVFLDQTQLLRASEEKAGSLSSFKSHEEVSQTPRKSSPRSRGHGDFEPSLKEHGAHAKDEAELHASRESASSRLVHTPKSMSVHGSDGHIILMSPQGQRHGKSRLESPRHAGKEGSASRGTTPGTLCDTSVDPSKLSSSWAIRQSPRKSIQRESRDDLVLHEDLDHKDTDPVLLVSKQGPEKDSNGSPPLRPSVCQKELDDMQALFLLKSLVLSQVGDSMRLSQTGRLKEEDFKMSIPNQMMTLRIKTAAKLAAKASGPAQFTDEDIDRQIVEDFCQKNPDVRQSVAKMSSLPPRAPLRTEKTLQPPKEQNIYESSPMVEKRTPILMESMPPSSPVINHSMKSTIKESFILKPGYTQNLTRSIQSNRAQSPSIKPGHVQYHLSEQDVSPLEVPQKMSSTLLKSTRSSSASALVRGQPQLSYKPTAQTSTPTRSQSPSLLSKTVNAKPPVPQSGYASSNSKTHKPIVQTKTNSLGESRGATRLSSSTLPLNSSVRKNAA